MPPDNGRAVRTGLISIYLKLIDKMGERKPHKATKRRLKQARREGNVLKSKGLTTAFLISGGILTIYHQLSFFLIWNKMLLEYLLIERTPELPGIAQRAGKIIFLGTMLTLVPAVLFGLTSEVFQVGLKIEWKPVAPKIDRLNPIAGFRRLFSSLNALPLTFLKITVLITAIALCVYQAIKINAHLPGGTGFIISEGSNLVLYALLTGVLILLFFGVLEYLFARRRYIKQLSMSHEEIRREFKEMEGDPFIRSARRSLHQEIVLRDLVKRIRGAKVVIVERN